MQRSLSSHHTLLYTPHSSKQRAFFLFSLPRTIMSPSITDESVHTPPRVPSPVHSFGTLAVHAGSPHDPTTGAVIESVRSSAALCYVKALLRILVQIALSTTFAQSGVGKPVGEYEYTRSSNPNR